MCEWDMLSTFIGMGGITIEHDRKRKQKYSHGSLASWRVQDSVPLLRSQFSCQVPQSYQGLQFLPRWSRCWRWSWSSRWLRYLTWLGALRHSRSSRCSMSTRWSRLSRSFWSLFVYFIKLSSTYHRHPCPPFETSFESGEENIFETAQSKRLNFNFSCCRNVWQLKCILLLEI